MKFALIKQIDLDQLGQELRVAAGIRALQISLFGNVLTVREDIDPVLTQQVIDAHVPPPEQPSTRELARDRLEKLKDVSSQQWDSVVLDILRYLGLQE